MKDNSLNIDLEVYTGPFDVLLSLIEKQKVDIYDIKIEDITNPYMETIKNMEIPIDQLSEFIYISSILLYIKSSKLMPKEGSDKVEEDFLEYLIEYKKIKSVEDDMKVLENKGLLYYYKFQEDLSKYSEKEEVISQDVEILSKEFRKIMDKFKEKNRQKPDIINTIRKLDVNDYVLKVRNTLKFTKKIRLESIINEIKSKDACIGTFLALLELVKTKEIYLKQDYVNKFLILKREVNS
ncbi:segregation/condensation protein A [Anaerococcus sp. AGMB00486]|uniref:Segregation and condensation protein A n=2 Tax=Anaerococcus TaxID=165779 RepID=A0ABX2N735_9FIRM|nr:MULTISPECIES: segregation/condensation protein A [Anaerococcus]MDY3007159.1 segregation/condensation protein A [Anaerococcus porci]MSS77004.1 chromosome segregation protein ScpA [Anaerococcus porci]NVF10507.1 segregation/condensation protein A [Anaerococcus faecalis]